MRASAGLPACTEGMAYLVPFARPEDIVQIAAPAERPGYHSVWGNDHMTMQTQVRQEVVAPPDSWEISVILAFVAVETTTLGLGAGMLVTPQRLDRVAVPKQIAVLDRFNQGSTKGYRRGRVPGRVPGAESALNPGARAQRCGIVEEGLQALLLLFTERQLSYEGQYHSFLDVEMLPNPHRTCFRRTSTGTSAGTGANLAIRRRLDARFLAARTDILQVDRLRDLTERAGRPVA